MKLHYEIFIFNHLKDYQANNSLKIINECFAVEN